MYQSDYYSIDEILAEAESVPMAFLCGASFMPFINESIEHEQHHHQHHHDHDDSEHDSSDDDDNDDDSVNRNRNRRRKRRNDEEDDDGDEHPRRGGSLPVCLDPARSSLRVPIPFWLGSVLTTYYHYTNTNTNNNNDDDDENNNNNNSEEGVAVVQMFLPSICSRSMKQDIMSDPTNVPLQQRSLYFYEFAHQLAYFSSDLELYGVLCWCLRSRFRQIIFHRSSSSIAATSSTSVSASSSASASASALTASSSSSSSSSSSRAQTSLQATQQRDFNESLANWEIMLSDLRFHSSLDFSSWRNGVFQSIISAYPAPSPSSSSQSPSPPPSQSTTGATSSRPAFVDVSNNVNINANVANNNDVNIQSKPSTKSKSKHKEILNENTNEQAPAKRLRS